MILERLSDGSDEVQGSDTLLGDYFDHLKYNLFSKVCRGHYAKRFFCRNYF